LSSGKTRAEDRDGRDRRGGIIWHTQGSGKSLTMVFLVRRMRCDPALRRFKIVFVTDRKDLQSQLAASADLAGEPTKQVRRVKDLRPVLAPKGPGIVFAMIQKYRDLDGDDGVAPPPEDATVDHDVINDDTAILVLVDEAHRSHTDALHANLDAALPNAARIGFTGTPIVMGEKKRTRDIFGEIIDKYTLRQSEADGATVPIVYEGRTAQAAVADGRDLDELFEDMLRDRTPEELERIKQKYATKGDVVAAPKLIAAKAVDILEHYVQNVLPNGFKAQLVAVTRAATLLYREKLQEAQAAMLAEIDALDPAILALDDDAAADLPRRQRILRGTARWRDRIATLEFAPVISGGTNDPDAYAQWTDREQIEARIAQFKRPLFHEDPTKSSPVAFLIVKSMLLTGFDAPGEQVLYLDRAMREAELLQAIARVNRTHGEKKRVGLVVDYYGVARHLAEALAAYEHDDVEGALHSIKEELPKLRDQHARLVALFGDRDIRVSGVLSRREREALADQFRGWRHPEIGDPARAAMLGDGTARAAMRAVVALERFLLAPTGASGKDEYSQLHPRFVQAVRRLLDPRTPRLERDTYARELVMLVEPLCFKVLAMLEPEALTKLGGAAGKRKKGLGAALEVLRKQGRSRYTLDLA
ncbi:MAG: HsdR family type I site-specific deoxyribonuclease, partial [Myxococcales bacterium]|nr:HsdR family type I site-specific deoxyribonuclease [Myxococcales bacterium]